MATSKKVREEDIYQEIVPCSGNWFQISIEYFGPIKPSRCVMTRVALWGRKRINGGDFIEGIDSIGAGHVFNDMDYFYVYGDDKCPTGKTWNELFNETPSFNWGIKEIPDLFAEKKKTKKK